jgi:4,5-dihydroxyphthalate decarboxylase
VVSADPAFSDHAYAGDSPPLAEKHPWLPVAVFKAFERSKTIALAKLGDTSATKVTLPFVEEQLRAARLLMGEDFWAYGLEPNRHVLTRFL